MKKRKGLAVLLLALLALGLAAGMHIGEALAYFTTYASASGKVQVSLDFTETETGDDVKDWTKHISIKNTGDQECFVRVKVLAGEKYRDHLAVSPAAAGDWEQKEDGYWYYSRPVAPKEQTGELLAALKKESLRDDIGNGEQEEFNVIVVQEYTPVLYNEAGEAYADWTMKVNAEGRADGGDTRKESGQ